MTASLTLRPHTLAVALAAAGLLTACGSSGGGDPPPPPPATGITLVGVVAKGAALANVTVSVTCATGTATATTNASGSYSVSINGGALPCVLKATSTDSVAPLHSVAPASTSSSVTANITPLTELVVAQLTGKDPAAYVAAVTPGALATTATASAVAAAQTALASKLTAGGLDTSKAGDFISGTLVAATGSNTPNDYDKVLDALNAQLVAAGTTLAALTATVVAESPAAPPPTPTQSADPSLPADLLIKPKAPNCAALASGSYWLIKLAPSNGSTVTAVDSFDLDAPNLTFKNTADATDTFTLQDNGNCRYTFPDDLTDDIVVAPSGVGVAAITVGLDDDSVAVSARGKRLMILLVPKQTMAVADLAGTWNGLSWDRNATNTAFESKGVLATVAASGAVTQVKCDETPPSTPESGCNTVTTQLPAFSANNAGGFNLTSTNPLDPWADRAFAYRAGNGELMVALLSPNGDFNILTKARTLTLPTVGTLTANWNVYRRANGLSTDPLDFRTHTIASVDSTAGTLVRNTAKDGSTVTAPETLEYNRSRNGYFHRPAATATASDGTPTSVREAWLLPLRGFGMTGFYLPGTSGTGATSNAFFGLSVSKQP
jgi:hypothetical protein